MSEATLDAQPEADAAAQPAAGLPRDQQAMALVNSYVPWAAASGMIPVPTADMVVLVGLQLRMLSKLGSMYNVSFTENSVKSSVSALIGTVVASGAGASLGSLIKAVPVVGTYIGFVATPGTFAAVTYAIGRVFVTHFEAGGTFLDFDPQKTREFFKAEFEKAKATH
jgi:uncharacterized protein (DUF697 family)